LVHLLHLLDDIPNTLSHKFFSIGHILGKQIRARKNQQKRKEDFTKIFHSYLLKLILKIAPLLSSHTYKEPSGPSAKPQGLALANLGLVTISVPANPFAKISQSPDGLPF